ncbi:MAG: RNA polymerase sigma factor [Gemmatimonadales bacterium]|nr:RNA polymerase sigma factor [Gemmatimonadales bacterium]
MAGHLSRGEADDPDLADARRAAGGDHDAFERLYSRHAPRVRVTARWLLGGGDLDAAVQDVFVRLWEQLRSFSERAAFRTWFSRVTVNVLLRRRERAGRERRLHAPAPILARQAAPDAGAELRSQMADAVDRLPPRAREVFLLHDVHGYSPAEIAETLGLTLNTVRSQIARSRIRLRHYLDARP